MNQATQTKNRESWKAWNVATSSYQKCTNKTNFRRTFVLLLPSIDNGHSSHLFAMFCDDHPSLYNVPVITA